MRHQPRTKSPKILTSASLHHAIRREIEESAKRFGVSKSWVVTYALAEQFGIDVVTSPYSLSKEKKSSRITFYSNKIG